MGPVQGLRSLPRRLLFRLRRERLRPLPGLELSGVQLEQRVPKLQRPGVPYKSGRPELLRRLQRVVRHGLQPAALPGPDRLFYLRAVPVDPVQLNPNRSLWIHVQRRLLQRE